MASGPDTAWYSQCWECYELRAAQLELIIDRPGGVPIMIYRCRRCGTTRSCRPGWHTRCHVCLDERSSGPIVTEAGWEILSNTADGRPGLTPPSADQIRRVVEGSSHRALADALRAAGRPGWEVLAADIHGLPWAGRQTRVISHGTWGRHQVCGMIAKLRPGPVDCPACGTDLATDAASADSQQHYLLYLLVQRGSQKFGVGDRREVETRLQDGAEVVQVLRASFTQVVLAEDALRQQFRRQIPRQACRTAADSSGGPAELTRPGEPINLAEVLPEGEDVTDWFR